MRITRTTSVIAVLLLVTSLLPAAMAQTYTLGIGPNDVRDEPQFASENNGFPHTDFQPQESTLILESYVQHGQYFAHFDTNNIINRAVHGNSYDSWEEFIHPGLNVWEAWWGWWTDTGSGGPYQEDQVTRDEGALPDVKLDSAPNGAIDDDDDGDTESTWDEFVWRGPNPDAQLHGQCLDDETTGDGDDVYSYDECAEDEMYVFVQPGTHDIHVNCLCALGNHADEGGAPDFVMEWNPQDWREENGFARVHYDQSLLMATTVITSVDPVETGPGLYDPTNAEAHDKDAYSALHPTVEQLYRTAVYDPGDQVDSPTDAVHEEGVKQFAKEDPTRALETHFRTVNDAYRGALGPAFDAVNPVRGLADDQIFPNFRHEPNTAGDIYGIDATGTQQDWATFDPATSYGGEPYYDPGPNQQYNYDTEEHFWGDSFAMHDGSTNAVLFRAYGGDNYGSPGLDDAGSPMGSHSMLPGHALYLTANVGTWFDRNADTWIGNVSDQRNLLPVTEDGGLADTSASSEDDPYASGMIDDPNDYGHTQDGAPDTEKAEWRGTCAADMKWTVEPTSDPDGDGLGEWGTTGVYVYESTFDPYTPAVQDATGGFFIDLPGPLGWVSFNDTDDVQGAEQGDQLSRYVTEGPIEITATCSSVEAGSGSWDPTRAILFPTGNVDYGVEIVYEATLTDAQRVAVDGAANAGNSLTGESIVDVDYLEPTV